jgi:hypothetical protein
MRKKYGIAISSSKSNAEGSMTTTPSKTPIGKVAKPRAPRTKKDPTKTPTKRTKKGEVKATEENTNAEMKDMNMTAPEHKAGEVVGYAVGKTLGEPAGNYEEEKK